MYLGVFFQRSLISKLLAALLARVRLLSGVSPHVRLQVVQLREGFRAFAAAVWLDGQVDPLMSIQVVVRTKRLSAVGAQIRLNV